MSFTAEKGNMTTNYITTAIEGANRNPSRCKTWGWKGIGAICACLPGTKMLAMLTPTAASKGIDTSTGLIVVEYFARADGYDDNALSTGRGIYLMPTEEQYVVQRLFPLTPAGIEAATRCATAHRIPVEAK